MVNIVHIVMKTGITDNTLWNCIIKANEWLHLLKAGALYMEKKNYFRFGLIVLQDLLGYDVRKDLDYEEENIEFSFWDTYRQKGVCIEAKGTTTKDLFSDQHRNKPEHSTPIKQTWDNMGRKENFDFGIATNYRDFVLIDKSKGYSKYYHFDFMEIENNDNKLREFIAIFSKESIIDKGFLPKLYEESILEEREFTKQFYKLYHETRLMLIKEFEGNTDVSKDEAIHYAQIFLNRLFFLFFAEDTNKVKKRLFKDNSKFLYCEIGTTKKPFLEDALVSLKPKDFVSIDQSTLGEKPWSLNSDAISGILEKIKKSGPNIMEFFERILQGVISGDDAIYFLRLRKDNGNTMIFFSEKTNEEVELEKNIMRPIVFGEHVKRFGYVQRTDYFVIYPYITENGKQRILEETELEGKYPLSYEYMSQFKTYLVDLKKKFKTNPKYWYSLHRGRQEVWFERHKIITPEISLGCNMTLDRNKLFHNTMVYSFLKRESTEEDIRFLLGILNSNLTWFFLKNTGVVLRGGYFRFKTKYLEPLNIAKPINKENENEFIKIVDMILDLNQKFYMKYTKFQNRLVDSFGEIQITSKIDKFYHLSFNSFLNEISKTSKLKISLAKQDEWEDYFNLYKEDLLSLQSAIVKADSKLNDLVFELYKLNENERKVIEDDITVVDRVSFKSASNVQKLQ